MSLGSFAFLAALCVAFIKYGRWLFEMVRRRVALSKLPTLTKTAYPLVGHSYLFTSDPADFFRIWGRLCLETIMKTGDKLGVFWIGPIPIVLLIHPDAAEVFLRSSKHLDKSSSYSLVRPWLGDGLVLSRGEKWSQRRKLITPTFHFNILEDFLVVMNEQAQVLTDRISSELERGADVDIAKLVGMCALDIICETAMGCQVNAQRDGENEYAKAIEKMGYHIENRMQNPLFTSDFIFNLSKEGREQRKTLQTLHGFTRAVIDERMAATASKSERPPRRMALLDVLLRAVTEDGRSLSAADIREEVDTFMFAGHDTSTVTLTWAIYLLGRHPDVQRKLQDELDAALADGAVTTDVIRKLSYMDRVIKEVLRMYPPGSFISRTTAEECVVAGHRIPKHTDVTIFIYMIHRNPRVWLDPGRFDPDRFTSDARAGKNPYQYIPFSAGQRNCVGQRFAVQEQKVVLAHFFRKFSVVAHDDEDELKVSAGLVLKLVTPLKLTITKRDVRDTR